jgi:hypothetical protein
MGTSRLDLTLHAPPATTREFLPQGLHNLVPRSVPQLFNLYIHNTLILLFILLFTKFLPNNSRLVSLLIFVQMPATAP